MLVVMVFGLAACEPECPPILLNVIDRTSWGAAEPDIVNSVEGFYDPVFNPGGWYVYQNPLKEALNTIVIHHSATTFNDTPRDIQRIHIESERYADVAYHYLIDNAGLIYEGRSINVRGAHTGGHNTGTVGIVLIGNFETEEPTTEQLCSLKRLSIQLKNEYDLTHLAGHRDFQPGVTVCPGEHLADKLEGIAADLNLEYSTEGYVGIPLS
jgi:hypothetical protein